jgi:PIN domain nuclease of toxin-antitoxin system
MLLDTHAWIWAASDEAGKLGPKTRRAIERAAAGAALLVTTASAFEITALATAGRLRLNQSAEKWIRDSIARGRLRVIDIDLDIAIDAGAIPSSALADPVDRLLVASARAYDVALVTRDRQIIDYANRSRLVRVSDAAA